MITTTAESPPPPDMMTIQEAADYLRMSKATMERLLTKGAVTRSRLSTRVIRIRREVLDAYVRSGEAVVSPPSPPKAAPKAPRLAARNASRRETPASGPGPIPADAEALDAYMAELLREAGDEPGDARR